LLEYFVIIAICHLILFEVVALQEVSHNNISFYG